MQKLDLSSLLRKAEVKEEKDGCKGRYYRVMKSKYINNAGSITFTTQFRPLKRRSCKGCVECGWLEDDLRERDLDILFEKDFEGGEIVTIISCNEHTDWETGHVDDYDIKFVSVNEEK